MESGHHVLDIGCGWGTLAIRFVKKTGCKFTGITLSEEQLKYAKRKVKESGLEVSHISFLDSSGPRLSFRNISQHWKFKKHDYKYLLYMQDRITLLLCDYRQIPNGQKFDRIISW